MKILRIVFLTFFAVILLCAALCFKAPESDILKAFVSSNSIKSKAYISKLAALANTKVNIIFESENEENLEELKNIFLENFPKAQKQSFEGINEVVETYKNYPNNFLSEKTRNLLKNKDYITLDNQSLERLYNPLGIYIAPPDKDPYLFATDYALKNFENINEDIKEYNEKLYNLVRYEITDKNDLKLITKAVKISNNSKFGHVYLTGVSVHSYYSALRSSIEVNVICIIATIAFILICLHYFKNPKILLPIVLSIVFGMLCGLSVTVIWFKHIHVLTFVFSTSLIGISLDYSLHYLLSDKGKAFKKSLLLSLISTIIAFLLLYFSNIEVLKQISVFTIFGLIGVYIFVLIMLPLFKIQDFDIEFQELPVKKYSRFVFAFVIAVICFGGINLKCSDDLKSLYQPKGELLKAEILYNKAFEVPNIRFLLTKGDSVDEILKREEKTLETLNKQNVKHIALSDYVSSQEKQRENLNLVKELYKKNLKTYAGFLEQQKINELLIKQNNELFNPEDFVLNEKFMIDTKTSFMLVENPPEILETINVQSEMTEVIKTFRIKCLKLIPVIFVGIFAILTFFMKPSKAIKLVIPSLLGGLFALSCVLIFNNPINVFHILAFILVIGFSLDYSIFRANSENKSKLNQGSNLAVFVSVLSSTISFTLLGFAGFKVISSLGIVLALGIFMSYLLSLIIIEPQ